MNTISLSEILKNELLDLKINTFTNGKSGTLELAEDYIQNKQGCTSKRKEKSLLEMFYNGKYVGHIQGQSPSTNEKQTIRIANNKIKTEGILKDNDIKTTESRIFEVADYSEAKEFINSSRELMVVKPYNLSAGKGITLNVSSSNFEFAWKHAVNAYNTETKLFKVMIQPMVEGIETRMLVVEGLFNSAILRVPANITGDGESTISELVEIKNNLRKNNPHLKRLLINIDNVVKFNLKQQSMTAESIPEKDKLIFLHNSSNVSQGGDSYEISHLVNKDMIKTAESAVSALPGLNTAGVDLIFKSFKDSEPVVLELNPGANLRMHHYPWKGEPKTPVFDLIDSMLNSFKNKQQLSH